MNNTKTGTLCLLFATLIWGSAFVAQSAGMELIGPFTFQAFRCAIAVFFLIPLSYFYDCRCGDQNRFLSKWKNPLLWKTGVICGCALFVAASLQQVGLVYTDAGKAGFITAMYIVMVPILGLFLRIKPSKTAVLSVAIAIIGLYLLSCFGVSEINIGDILVLGCAIAFGVQILLIDRFAATVDGFRLNCVQALIVSVISFIIMFLTEKPDLSAITRCWLPIMYAGVFSMGVAYSLQIIGQKHLEPTSASLIMSLESVFAALCGWLLLHETMTATELLGCVLVFTAVIISQIKR